MPLKFKQPRGPFPSGGFEFTDPKTGLRFNGMSADLRLQAQHVMKHRLANPKIYPIGQINLDSIIQEIITFTCNRLPHLCEDSDTPMQSARALVKTPNIRPPAHKSCVKCGSKNLTPSFCKTCGGSKVTSWICNDCKFISPK